MRVPFPLGLEGVEGLPRTRRELRNCWNDKKGHIIGRPGVEGLNTTGRVARGSFVWNDGLYVVASQDLLKVDTDGSFTVIGTIADVETIETAIGFNEAVIVVKGSRTYTLDKSDVLTDITDNANIVANRDVAHINGRFVYIPDNGDPAYFSDIGAAGTVQPESFFDAEELPDRNNSVWNFKNTLYIGGTDSIELFRDSGASPNPFTRVNGGRLQTGVIGGVLEYNETFAFVGREKDQDFGIYAIGQGLAPKLSNEAIDLVLSGYSQSQLENAIPGRLKWRGYDVMTMTFQRDSFGFYSGGWFRLDSVTDGFSVPWKAGFITQFEGKYYSAFEDRIGVFAQTNEDYGDPITRVIDTGFEQENDEFFRCQSLSLGISQGFSRTEGSVAIAMSRDGETYGEPYYRNLGDLGQYGKQLVWNLPGGLGTYDGFMGVRVYTTEDLPFSGDYMVATLR